MISYTSGKCLCLQLSLCHLCFCHSLGAIFLKLVEKLSGAVTQRKLKESLDAVKVAKESILNDKELEGLFLQTASSSEELSKEEKQLLFRRLAEKAANARFSEELRNFREANTTRGFDGKESKQSFRDKLKGFVHNIPEAKQSTRPKKGGR